MSSTQDVMDYYDSLTPEEQKRFYLTAAEICRDSPNAVIDDNYVKKLQAEGVTPWPPAH